jgi:hypothetical protein
MRCLDLGGSSLFCSKIRTGGFTFTKLGTTLDTFADLDRLVHAIFYAIYRYW